MDGAPIGPALAGVGALVLLTVLVLFLARCPGLP
jgi:hypothetical protein